MATPSKCPDCNGTGLIDTSGFGNYTPCHCQATPEELAKSAFPSDAERIARTEARAIEISRGYEDRTFNWLFSR